MTRVLLRTVGVVVLLVVLAACAGMMAKEPSLYERLGGRHPIALIVDDFVAHVLADDRINARFKTLKFADVARLKTNLSDQICEAAGGSCSYYGRDMKTAHKGMNITEAEWNATVEALVKAIDGIPTEVEKKGLRAAGASEAYVQAYRKRQVPAKEKSQLLRLLGPMKGDIVGQ